MTPVKYIYQMIRYKWATKKLKGRFITVQTSSGWKSVPMAEYRLQRGDFHPYKG